MTVVSAVQFSRRFFFVATVLSLWSSHAQAQAPAGGAADALNREAEIAFDRRQYKDAIAGYQKLIQGYPNSEFAVDARFHLAYANFLTGQYDPAVDDLRKLLGSPTTPPETQELAALLLPQVLAQQAAGLPAGDAKRQPGFEAAIREYDAFIAKYPKSASLESALYGRAVADYQIARYDAAARDLRQVRAAFPNSDTVQDSTFLLAITVATQANLGLAKENPTPAETDAAGKGYAEAEGLLGEIIGKKTDISLANDAQFQLGETLLAHASALPIAARNTLYDRALAAYRAVEPKEGMILAQSTRLRTINDARIAALRQGPAGRSQARQLDERRLREQGKLEALQAKEDPVLGARIKGGVVYYDLQRYDETRVLLTTLLPGIRKPEDEKLALYYVALSYAAQRNVNKAVAAYDQFQAKYSGDPVAENLPFVIGELFSGGPKPDPARATKYFDEFARLYPKSRLRETALLVQASNEDQLGRYDDALKTLDTFLQGKPKRELIATAEQTRASVLKDKKDLDGALAVFKKVRDTYKDRPEGEESAFWVGWTLLQKKDYPGAISELKAFVDKYPQSRLLPSALAILGQAQQASGAKDAALATLADVSNRFPQSQEATAAYFGRANIFLADRKYDDAANVLTEFTNKRPDSEQAFAAYEQIAAIQTQQTQIEAAAATYEKFLGKQPASPQAPAALGKLAALWLRAARAMGNYIVLGAPQRETWKADLAKSIAASEQQLDRFPEAPATALGLRDLLDCQRLLIEAKVKTLADVRDYFQKLADKYENDPGARGRILFRLAALTAEKDPAQALADMKTAYDPAVVYSPADAELYTDGLLPGDPDTAAQVFDKLARDYPSPPGVPPAQAPPAVQDAQSLVLYGRGTLAALRGDQSAAAQAFTELKRSYPRSSKLAEANLGLAQNLLAQGKPNDALPLLAEVAKNPRSPLAVRAHGLFLNGEIQAAKGSVEAIDSYLKVAAFYPTAPDAPEGLSKGAGLLEKQAATLPDTPAKPGAPTKPGQLARARKAYNDLVMKYPDSKWTAQAKARLAALPVTP